MDQRFLLCILISLIATKATEFSSHGSTYCDKLRERYKPAMNTVTIYNEARQVIISSTDRTPSQATAGLLKAALKNIHGYDVLTESHNTTHCEIAANLPPLDRNKENYDKLFIYIDADFRSNCTEVAKICDPTLGTCNVGGTRLENMGFATALSAAWHVKLTNKAQKKDKCAEANTWDFYQNEDYLRECDFPVLNSILQVPVLLCSDVHSIQVEKDKNKMDKIQKRLKFLDFKIVDRKELTSAINDDNNSFLFIDYNLWNEQEKVQVIEESPQIASYLPKVSLRLADIGTFRSYAPLIVSTMSSFNPHPEILRQILEIHSNSSKTLSYEEAACCWAYDHEEEFKSQALYNMNSRTHQFFQKINFIVILCKDSSVDNEDLMRMLDEVIMPWLNKKYGNTYSFFEMKINCYDENSVNVKVDEISRDGRLPWVMGFLAPGTGATKAAADKAEMEQIPIIYYDLTQTSEVVSDAASTSTGNIQRLSNATRWFFLQHDWKRIAIISENTSIAKDFSLQLKKDSSIVFKEVNLLDNDKSSVKTELLRLKQANAHIFFLNTNSQLSNSVACLAGRMGMTPDEGYAWVARDFNWQTECTNPVPVFTVSYGWRGGDMSQVANVTNGNEELQKELNEHWKAQTWPPLAALITDAAVMMINAVDALIKKHPERRYALHGKGTSRLLAEELAKTSVGGVTQQLQQEGHTLKNPLMFVSLWQKNRSELLKVWQAFGSGIKEQRVLKEPYQNSKPPNDGRSHCLTTTDGDPFNPRCMDFVFIVTLVVIILSSIILAMLARARKKKMMEWDDKIRHFLQLLQDSKRQSESNGSNALRKVQRSEIVLCDEPNLGTGHFGVVSPGILTTKDGEPRSVAVKALRRVASQEEEDEFLREAKALASLSHQNIVRLVGWCADGYGSPMLIMERAFFGDLLHYLRDRLYLFTDSAQTSPGDRDEKRHVSAKELTRLAREAAIALRYLEKQRLVHRDLRAANCLVDACRTLKLADFGLARFLNTNKQPTWPEVSDPDYKYILRRPTAFPARWTAPESIKHAEFSFASDVWALGVLMLEIVTFGAPPYGEWSDAQVLAFVRKGGKPPVPRDASVETGIVTDMCWNTNPALRANAGNVRNYLTMYPEALRPAYRDPDLRGFPKENKDQDQTDSGFGERLHCDWPPPLPQDPCISTF